MHTKYKGPSYKIFEYNTIFITPIQWFNWNCVMKTILYKKKSVSYKIVLHLIRGSMSRSRSKVLIYLLFSKKKKKHRPFSGHCRPIWSLFWRSGVSHAATCVWTHVRHMAASSFCCNVCQSVITVIGRNEGGRWRRGCLPAERRHGLFFYFFKSKFTRISHEV